MPLKPSVQQPDAGAAPDIARAIARLTKADILRLKAIARLRARGLPAGIGWSDLLNEAVTRALDGSRQRPLGLDIVVFLAGVMRSIADDHWRRLQREAILFAKSDDDAVDPAANPERGFAAQQALAALDQLFADDRVSLQILAGLAAGLSAPEICRTYGLSQLTYESARKRMRRLLLKRGIAWSSS